MPSDDSEGQFRMPMNPKLLSLFESSWPLWKTRWSSWGEQSIRAN